MALLHPLSQKFSILCSLFLIFLSTLLLQGNTRMFVLQDPWSNKTLNLGCFGLSFLTFMFRDFLTTYWQTSSSLERLKSLRILLALLGPRRRGTVVSVRPGISFSPFFTMTKLRTLRLASTMQPQADLHFQSPLASNQNAPYSAAGRNSRGSRHPASWGNLVCRSHH